MNAPRMLPVLEKRSAVHLPKREELLLRSVLALPKASVTGFVCRMRSSMFFFEAWSAVLEPPAVRDEFKRRSAAPQEIRSTTHGYGYLALGLAVDISSTEIRAQLQRGTRPDSLIPGRVLDYIEQQHLYRNS